MVEAASIMASEIHPSLLRRKIIHFDMDAFYASVEERDDPALRGRPVVVGGSPQSRGVVCTANYIARKFGIHSAMSCARAARLCPEAIFVRPDFAKYSTVSSQIRRVFAQYTGLIEPLSLDEAYLDVTENPQGLYATRIASQIQQEIRDTLKLTGSAGVAPNKLLAKIASDMRKPLGLTVVLPAQALNFIAELPLRKIHGIGAVTEKTLAAHGLHLCRDVWTMDEAQLRAAVGENMAQWLQERSRGIDERPVETERVRKSLGREETFATDIIDVSRLRIELAQIAEGVAADLRQGSMQGRTITLKVRYADFSRITRSQTLSLATDDVGVISQLAQDLLAHTEAGRRKIRLLGISMAKLASTA